MQTAVMLSAEAAPWPELVDYVVEAERLGVDSVRLYPAGDDLDGRLTTLGRALDLVRQLGD